MLEEKLAQVSKMQEGLAAVVAAPPPTEEKRKDDTNRLWHRSQVRGLVRPRTFVSCQSPAAVESNFHGHGRRG